MFASYQGLWEASESVKQVAESMLVACRTKLRERIAGWWRGV